MNSRRIIRATAIVSVLTAASRVLGFAREVLMAVFFGTSLAKSAFDVAFQIPNLFRRLFGEGALSAAFVPVFSRVLQRDGEEAAGRFAGKVLGLLAVVLLFIVVAALLLVSAALHFPHGNERLAAVLPLLRIMFPYMFFICVVAFFMGVLNTLRRFAVPAATPIVLNAVWILSILFISPLFGDEPAQRIYGVAWGILLAGVLQLLAQWPALRGTGIHIQPSLGWHEPDVRRVLLLMGPAALGLGVLQVNVLIDRVLALIVGDWAPAALVYAERLVYLPLGIFATALGTVLLPTFSGHAADADHARMRDTLQLSMRALLLVMVPAAFGLLFLAGPIIDMAFRWEGGKFDAISSVYTARALAAYALGLVVFGLHKVLVPAFYAMEDTRTPVRVGLWGVLLNIVLNITFIVTWPSGYRHAGLALATVISSGFNCIALAVLLTRRIGSPGWRYLLSRAVRIVACGLVMAVVAGQLVDWLGFSNVGLQKWHQLRIILTAVTGAVVVYAGLAACFCGDELRLIVQRRNG